MKKYDYLIVGAGLAGSMFAYEAKKRGKTVKVIDKRPHIGGNLYCKKIDGINVHYYGAHIFHTSNKVVWDYIDKFAKFNHFRNSPIAYYKNKIYNLPFNMNTFNQLWGTITPEEVEVKLEKERKLHFTENPSNLEEQAINLVGKEMYETLIKGYTEKQWGRSALEIPNWIIKRLPVRFTYDNNYFNDTYQGIPIGGYNTIIENMLLGIEVELNVDYLANKKNFSLQADKIVFTGAIDAYFDYCFGALEYRSLEFDHKHIKTTNNFQGNAVVNYTEREVPYTRIIEHKHFEFGEQVTTVITYEYPKSWNKGDEPYYPINDEKNTLLYEKYKKLADKETTIFLGRLAEYKYYDMDKVIERTMEVVSKEFNDNLVYEGIDL